MTVRPAGSGPEWASCFQFKVGVGQGDGDPTIRNRCRRIDGQVIDLWDPSRR